MNAAGQTQLLYDSDNFTVLWQGFTRPLQGMVDLFRAAQRGLKIAPDHESAEDFVFEIVDKRSLCEAVLQDAWAKAFAAMIRRWQANIPSEQEVEEELDAIVGAISTQPLVMH